MWLVNRNEGRYISSGLNDAVLPLEKGGLAFCFILIKKKKDHFRVSDIYNIAILNCEKVTLYLPFSRVQDRNQRGAVKRAWAWEPAKLMFDCFLAVPLGRSTYLSLSFFMYKMGLIWQCLWELCKIMFIR